jgi:hypothetical protein
LKKLLEISLNNCKKLKFQKNFIESNCCKKMRNNFCALPDCIMLENLLVGQHQLHSFSGLSNPNPSVFFETHFNICFPFVPRFPKFAVSYFHVFWPKFCIHHSSTLLRQEMLYISSPLTGSAFNFL